MTVEIAGSSENPEEAPARLLPRGEGVAEGDG